MFDARPISTIKSIAALLFAFSLVATSAPVLGQNATEVTTSTNELDRWSGSSLGIRLDFRENRPEIIDVYDHVADSSPFMKGDRILTLGSLNFPESDGDALADLLAESDPGTELAAKVKRGEDELQVNVTTFRKELVDIAAIFRRLNGNKIIKNRLEETQREDLFDDFKSRMAKAVRASQSPRKAAEAINRIIDEVDVSHTAIIPASSGIGFSSKAKGGLGLILQRHTFNGRTGYYVIDKKPGSPSYDSDILLGDEILSVNGVDLEDSRRLKLSGHEDRYQLFVIDAGIDEVCQIEYLRSPFDDAEIATLTSLEDLSTVASVKASKRTIRSQQKKIGYIRFWNLMSMGVNSALSKASTEEFAECDAVILDLRGRGGIVPAVLALNRTVAKIDKPVVVTIDGLTRSAKEMLTYLLKKQENVLVVGQKTSGAVTGATVFRLPSGNSLMYPVASADSLKQFIDGAILEGVGVEPDEPVDFFIPYCAGQDRILNFAVKRAVELVNKKDDIAKTNQANKSNQSNEPAGIR